MAAAARNEEPTYVAQVPPPRPGAQPLLVWFPGLLVGILTPPCLASGTSTDSTTRVTAHRNRTRSAHRDRNRLIFV
nr:unnamed protein product [Digitaria exilis]